MKFLEEYKKSLRRAVIPVSFLILIISMYILAQTQITEFQFYLTVIELIIFLALISFYFLFRRKKKVKK